MGCYILFSSSLISRPIFWVLAFFSCFSLSSAQAPLSSQDLSSPHNPTPPQVSGFIIGNTNQTIVPKSQEFIQTLAAEIFHKTGVRVYVDIIDTITLPSAYPTKQSRKQYQEQLAQSLQAPYVVVFLFVQERKFDFLSSQDLHGFLDSKKLDSIYFDYMAPLLPEKEQELTPQRYSSIILNGYAEIADVIARHYEIALENNMESNGQGVRTFVRFIMYGMILILLGLFIVAHFLGRKSPK